RPSLDKYLQLGYVPSDGNAWGGPGETLEVGAADFGISQLASRLGNATLSRQFLARARGWRKTWNPAQGGWVAERDSRGVFQPLNPASSAGFAEGSAAQYTWMIPYNARGLFTMMGGNATANTRLDRFFHNADGSFALTGAGGLHAEMDNEPS